MLKTCHFEDTEDIMTKFKQQGLHVIRIKYWKAGESGNPPSFIPALLIKGILLHKQATKGKHFCPECICSVATNVDFYSLFFSLFSFYTYLLDLGQLCCKRKRGEMEEIKVDQPCPCSCYFLVVQYQWQACRIFLSGIQKLTKIF